MKYCNRCGAQLAGGENTDLIKATEKRLGEYLDGLFWITVFGLAVMVGGLALMKKLQLGETLMVAFLIVSAAAFVVNFWLSLREVQRLKLELKQVRLLEPANTKELPPPSARSAFDALPSVTEHTTRDLQGIAKEKIPL